MRKYMLIMAVVILVFTNPLFAQFGTNCPSLKQQQAIWDADRLATSDSQATPAQKAKYWDQKYKDITQHNWSERLIAKDAQQQAKDAQQQAKDAQQQAKDKQQADKDAQQAFYANNGFKCPRPCCNGEVKKEEPKVVCQPKVTCEPEAKQGYVCWKKDAQNGWCKKQDGQQWVTNWKGTFIDGIPEPEYRKLEKEAKKKFTNDPFQEANELAKLKDDYRAKHTNRSGGFDNTNPGGGGNQNGFNNPNNASN